MKKQPWGQDLKKIGSWPLGWLAEVEFPDQRKAQKEKGRKWPRIEVGGDTMRVGKTTAAVVLNEQFKRRGLSVNLSDEDWQSNPYLFESYRDSSKTIFESQKWFAQRKYEQLGRENNSIMIQCVHPEMDFCYALTNAIMGKMNQRHFKAYMRVYLSLGWDKIAAPDLLVYVTASDDILVNRAQRSARDFEVIDPEYLLVMKFLNQTWLSGAKKRMEVLVIDTDNFNFALNQKSRKELSDQVIKKLKQRGWRLK